MPPTTRDTIGNSGNVNERPDARAVSSSAILEKSRNLEISSCASRPESTEKTEGQDRKANRHRTHQKLFHASKKELLYLIILVELIFTVV